MEHRIEGPFTKEKLKRLRFGDTVLLTGTVYTARDAAHKRLTEMIQDGKTLPFDLKDSIIYYVGPTPAKPGNPIGSAGPTTSYRMDPYAPLLLDLGQSAMIGKGQRSEAVQEAIQRNWAVYFAAVGGAAAFMAQQINEANVIAFEDLGPEAIRKLSVVDFPVTVVIDSNGGDLYKQGQQEYRKAKGLTV